MTDTLKILGQSNPSATTLTDVYTVPGATSTVVSSLTVCNRSSVPTAFRVSAAAAGAADNNKQYLFYDQAIGSNETFIVSLGMSLATTDVLRVYATLATLAFNFFGSEIT